jgi:hypothetical protein
MRGIIWLAIGVLGLVTAGIAVAQGVESKGVKQVSATFTATTASNVTSSTCKGTDGNTYAISRGTYTGTATSSEPSLNGPLTANVSSFVNTTTGVGTAQGRLRVATGSDTHTDATLKGVVSQGSIVGLATGRSRNAGLVANVSTGYSSAGGLTGGKLGGASGGDAVEYTSGGCAQSKKDAARIQAQGAVSALSLTSITVGSVTCTVPLNLQAAVSSKVKVGTAVRITCSVSGSTNTLTKLEAKGSH